VRARATAVLLTLVFGSIAPAVVAPTPAWAAPTLPAGFRLVDYPAGLGTYNLANFDFTPDGGLLAVGKNGRVTFTPPGGTVYTLGQVPNVRGTGDFGVLGLSLGSSYATTGQVFLLYPQFDSGTSGNAHGVLTEWAATPPQRPTSFTLVRTIIDGSQTSPVWTQNGPSHGIGTVLQAPDGSLFFGDGDDSQFSDVDPAALRADNLDDPHGKILHVLPDGRGDPSNPFYDAAHPSSWRSRVFASGFRNPFRFSIDQRSGALYVGDVGWRDVEEINRVTPGTNFGWPCFEGPAHQPGYAALAQCQQMYAAASQPIPPLYSYPHNGLGSSVVGGIFYQGSSYPAAYQGAYFFGDYTRNQLWTMSTDAAGAIVRAPESAGFGTGIGGPVAFRAGPNGDISYADLVSGNVRRLVYAPGNRPPQAVISTAVDAATKTVSFSADQSYDLDGDQLTYRWDFGDGATGTGVSATHTYAAAGTYQVTLTATDPLGAAGTATAAVTPDNYSPTLTLQTSDHLYAVGEPVAVTATATDPEDGDLSATVNWQVQLVHCPFQGSCHVHPGGEAVGATFSAPFTDHGSDTSMVITASVTDSKGTTTRQTYEAKPDLHTLTIVAPVPVRINGVEAVSTDVVTGSVNSVDAPAAQSYWEFVSWSDGGAGIHDVTMPAADLTLTATYRTAIAAKYAAMGGASSILGAPVGAEYDVPPGRARNYQGGRMYWSPATGVHWVHGGILTKYLASGGPVKWGVPTSSGISIAGGRANCFQKANIYWAPTVSARVVNGGILAEYLAVGGPDAWGFPLTDVITIAGGRATYFQKGNIYWTSPTGAHLVHGGILTKYLATGGPATWGFPTTDETSIAGGRANYFTKARIYWVSSIGAHVVHGGILTTYLALGGPDTWGFPTTDEIAVAGGRANYFQKARVYWTSATGAHLVRGLILTKYLSLGGPGGSLGFPTSNEVATSYGAVSRFLAGELRWNQTTNTVTVVYYK